MAFRLLKNLPAIKTEVIVVRLPGIPKTEGWKGNPKSQDSICQGRQMDPPASHTVLQELGPRNFIEHSEPMKLPDN